MMQEDYMPTLETLIGIDWPTSAIKALFGTNAPTTQNSNIQDSINRHTICMKIWSRVDWE